MVLISVITINKNNAIGLAKTIKSVISQDFKDFEFIVIDGNSDDGSNVILKDNSDKITYWSSENDSGIYNAMNKGIEKSQGKYLLFLNSGDYLVNNETLSLASKELDNTDIVYGDMVIDRNNQLEYVLSASPLLFEEMIRGTLWHPVSFIKKELFSKYGMYNEIYKIVSDYDFFLKTIYIHKVSIKHISQFISVFNTNGIGSSSKFQELHNAEKYQVQTTYFHPSIIKSAYNYSDLKRSKPQVVFNWLKTKPLLLKISKWIYSIAKSRHNGH